MIEEAEEDPVYDDQKPSDEERMILDEEGSGEPGDLPYESESVLTLGVFEPKRQRKRGMVRENQINEWKGI